jgi:hypothetical protein
MIFFVRWNLSSGKAKKKNKTSNELVKIAGKLALKKQIEFLI